MRHETFSFHPGPNHNPNPNTYPDLNPYPLPNSAMAVTCLKIKVRENEMNCLEINCPVSNEIFVKIQQNVQCTFSSVI